ncbi:unnamed protein product [Microthlaspi erraticum]|uniref:Protein transport protein SEC23 n=1 Tax=Microthlaspi erraticum TaxID=1685480 RepID=A0A6D2IGU0_9BRAS|nr:unnamed protein product [Microthlaspi erraticum]
MDPEGIDGVRMTWNIWPRTKIEASKCVVPFAASISPIRHHRDIISLPYAPLCCANCSAALNAYARVDFNAKLWICPICVHRNKFPLHYHQISETNLPQELYAQYTTIEYTLPDQPGAAPAAADHHSAFVFVLDTCMIEEEFDFAKSAIKQAIGLFPDNALVGFVSFGTQAHVHELGFSDLAKAYVFRGDAEVSKEQVLEQLGLAASGRRGPIGGYGFSNAALNRFLLPASECEYTLDSLLEELQTDQWPVKAGCRPLRCTGVALSVAVGLLGACSPGTGARIIALVGGPCSEGPGTIVSKDLSEPLRSHKDLDKGAAPFYEKAEKFYDGLANQLVDQGHVLDIFASALDQVGVAEMKATVERTGGLVVLSESYGHSVFKDSFKRVFEDGEQSLGLCSNGILKINCSKDIKVQGIIGPCASSQKKGPSVGDTVIGEGNTTEWKMCGLDKSTCLTVFFDISSSDQSSNPSGDNLLYLQFLTSYQNPQGKKLLSVTTVCRQWADTDISTEELVQGFDQETAAVVMARLASLRMETEVEFDATRWLDRNLIRICSKFGDYRKDEPNSFTLNPNFSLFPQFIFNLRRSQFVQVFNNSPDETAYNRMLLNRENISNAAVMIQPSLTTYSFNSTPQPALLDAASIAADRILLLDSYFSIVIFHGSTIAQWRSLGYQNQPEHQAFVQLLQAPQDDAQMIVHGRFPMPRLVVCDQHGSQARFLLAKLNPSASYNESETMNDVIFTDDVNLQVFYKHLQKLAVQS